MILCTFLNIVLGTNIGDFPSTTLALVLDHHLATMAPCFQATTSMQRIGGGFPICCREQTHPTFLSLIYPVCILRMVSTRAQSLRFCFHECLVLALLGRALGQLPSLYHPLTSSLSPQYATAARMRCCERSQDWILFPSPRIAVLVICDRGVVQWISVVLGQRRSLLRCVRSWKSI